MITVKTAKEMVYFGDLDVGDTFIHERRHYIRIAGITLYDPDKRMSVIYNAVSLEDGILQNLLAETEVEPFDADLVIK